MTNIIDGNRIAAQIRAEVFREVETLKSKGITPGLTVVIVGENPGSVVYVKNKEKDAKEVGFKSEVIRIPQDTTQEYLLKVIDQLNKDETVHGLLIQLPLPKHIDELKVIEAINPQKDVDGFHPVNVGKVVIGDKRALVSCTPAGVIALLEHENLEIAGKEVVIVGRSNIVGKPLVPLFLQKNATVTVCHSKSQDLRSITKRADILVVAIGKSRFITADYVKPGAVVIDVGINRLDGKLTGDVDFLEAATVASKITPVPGGVGPMTRAMLLKNTIQAAKLQNEVI